MHRLLERQLRRYQSEATEQPSEQVSRLLQAISDAYEQMDDDRDMLERSLELTSQELNARNGELLRSNDELEKFAYVVSHDLQEPLRSIAGHGQLFERRYRDTVDEDGLDLLDGLVGGVRRMQEFIQDLLEYARAGRELRIESFCLGELIEVVMADLRSAIEASGTEIQLSEFPMVHSDRHALRQVFLNLLSNAIKFRRPGVPPVVSVTVNSHDDYDEFLIRDNGIGIPEGQAERAFEMFQSLHSRSQFGGTGMGLAICAKLVDRLEGKLWVAPGTAEGTTFHLRLPRKGDA